MEYFFGWIIFSFVVGFIGSSRKIGFGGAFFFSLILSPVIGLIITLVSKNSADEEYKEKILKAQQEQQETLIKMSAAKPAAVSSISIIQELEKLKKLKDDDVITEDEFLDLKKKILDSNNFETSIVETTPIVNYTRTEKLSTGELLQFLDETDFFKNPEVRINDDIPNNGFYKLYDKEKVVFKIEDGKISNNYTIQSYKQKDGRLLEIWSQNISLYGMIEGDLVWLNNKPAPDGKYKMGFLETIIVVNGVIDRWSIW